MVGARSVAARIKAASSSRAGWRLIQHHQDELRLLHRPAAALHPHLLDGVAAVPKSGCVDEPQGMPPSSTVSLHRVPGGPGMSVTMARSSPARALEQGGLTRVGPPHDGAFHAPVQAAAPLVGGQQGRQGLAAGHPGPGRAAPE